jgi:hypothetical protein
MGNKVKIFGNMAGNGGTMTGERIGDLAMVG